jgi:fucose 4-O-acetylase-like acetyltransferase
MSITPVMHNKIDRENTDATKGILILLVIFGHAANFWTPEPFATFSLKFFHVACFLLLPYIYDIKPLTAAHLKTCIQRYYLPFAIAVLIYAAAYSLFITQSFSPAAFIKALTIANAPQLDAATGLRALWFLPALIAAIILNASLIGSLRIPALILIPAALIAHVTIGALEEPIKFLLPFGMTNVLYLFFIGIIIRLIYTRANHEHLTKLAPLWLILTLLAIIAAHQTGSLIKFPVMTLPDYRNISSLLIQDALILFAFMTIISNTLFRQSKHLIWLGRNSLMLYLTHLGFMAGSALLLNRYIDNSQITIASTAAVLIIFAISLLGGITCIFAGNFLLNSIRKKP